MDIIFQSVCNLSSSPGSPMRMGAGSLDNILDPRHDYPAPDYTATTTTGLAQATSTMSLPQMPMSTQIHMSQTPASQQGLLTTVGRPLSDPSMQQVSVPLKIDSYYQADKIMA